MAAPRSSVRDRGLSFRASECRSNRGEEGLKSSRKDSLYGHWDRPHHAAKRPTESNHETSAHFPKFALSRRSTVLRTSETHWHWQVNHSRTAFRSEIPQSNSPHAVRGFQIGGTRPSAASVNGSGGGHDGIHLVGTRADHARQGVFWHQLGRRG